ncbi:tRNA(fMet)-specific endonuclease VapC [Dyadobacter sp. BE34]|uniref:tRNA(fMet)-specific endonuclease VapC n=1 Tax=Dyadobacter fermentans TaxID=94254 RepID=A0ABU1QYT4_9BACT|nr:MULTISPECIES: type II toxin-antitoxin system VapC family toxin [Dyadobacter]MDR6805450.1 tRNA(fMet)-specific endonuclease VapC [Dyadobacter fermentans]MDR7042790.1 tRNA(fMet)-specific endonuclease VapC [Dyadobacter sp. BE242]MDR7197102.1 tRNA(fMet)-specific endonuclease VapC [Dyadobacter sp. BE34]MDR7215463.1 tRNA(fMet)-specific endonuclease VapC [Dyadobacter sp. BE31]MDR7262999.1 tRNA(fMet)-specific endonuclease VapC [Dyadobacter sp. BE32]
MALKHIAIDTNIAIEILNGNKATLQMLSVFDVIALPVPVCGELMYGAKNSSKAERNLAHYRAFIGSCEILEAKLPTAWEYANIKLNLKLAGRPIPENDIWIAAICQSYDIPFASRDGHFSYIQSLHLIGL